MTKMTKSVQIVILKKGRSYNLDFYYVVADGYYASCLDCGNIAKFRLQPSQTWVENQLHNFSQQQSHHQKQFNIGERCHGGEDPYTKEQVEIELTEEMDVELSCVAPGCKRCPGDEIWKTKPLSFIKAFE